MSESNVISKYESKYISVARYTSPFNYIIIDNLFNQTIYRQLCSKFPSFIARTVPYKDQPGATSDYEGYISGLSLTDLTEGYDFFASKELQNFVETQFNIETSRFISPSAHFHKAPSKSGFIHRDMNICSFPKNSSTDTSFVTPYGAIYTDDSNHNDTIKTMRSIALLYYLNNDDSVNASGGGTGIYKQSGELITTIEPRNNRLFMFEICQNSYHAFIGANYDRSAIVSWFHSSPSYMIHRHLDQYKKNPNLIERWSQRPKEEYWSIENDPDYHKYFGASS